MHHRRTDNSPDFFNIEDLITARASLDPSTPFALFTSGASISVGELDLLSRKVAAFLSANNVVKETRVAIVANTSPLYLALLVGIWRLGALALPIDDTASKTNLGRILTSFQPSLLIMQVGLEHIKEDFKSICSNRGIPVLPLSVDILPNNFDFPVGADPDIGALCIYTSGSTGNPKGVLISHRNLLEGGRNVIRAMSLSARDRALCVLPLFHMNGMVTTFISPLLSGGSVVFMPKPFDPIEAVKLIDRHHCTWFSGVPTHYASFMHPPLALNAGSLASLRFCRSASAPLSKKLMLDFQRHYNKPVIETMGMTETAGQIFANPMPPAKRIAGSVGVPVGFEARVMSEQNEPCPVGIKGELQVRGQALMLGYLDDEVETSKAMDGDWLKTGDIAEYDQDGYYFLRGRKKDIAIFAGTNISLRELECEINESCGITDVSCVGIKDQIFGEVVTIFLLQPTNGGVAAEMARKVSEAVLPLLPNRQALGEVRFVRQFPRSGVGKVLKNKLVEEPILAVEKRPLPSTPRELLAELLGIDPDMVRQNMTFRLTPGWDSLCHVSLVCGVEAVLDRRLEISEVLAITTFQGLCQVMEAKPKIELTGKNRRLVKEVVARLKDAGLGSTSVTYLHITYEACSRMGIEAPYDVLEEILAAIPSGSNLVMNGFSWAFCDGQSYHYEHTPCQTGLMNEVFRRNGQTIRGPHPIYSYLAQGPLAQELVAHDCPSCWGPGSATTNLLQRGDVKVVTFGIEYGKANPAMHSLEEKFKVPYRYYKRFRGLSDFGQGSKMFETSMFVRPIDGSVFNDWSPITDILRDRGLVLADEDKEIFGYDNADILEIGIEVLTQDSKALINHS